jgi:hypothetical protein
MTYTVTARQLEFLTGHGVHFKGTVTLLELVEAGLEVLATAALQFQSRELVERVLYRYNREIGLPPMQSGNLSDPAMWDHVIDHIEGDARNPNWRDILIEELSK